MAKHQAKTTTPTTRREPDTHKKQDWKRDRYEQRALKTSARRNITGGF